MFEVFEVFEMFELLEEWTVWTVSTVSTVWTVWTEKNINVVFVLEKIMFIANMIIVNKGGGKFKGNVFHQSKYDLYVILCWYYIILYTLGTQTTTRGHSPLLEDFAHYLVTQYTTGGHSTILEDSAH